jgi:DNA-binding LytR/AlgR family response regulator
MNILIIEDELPAFKRISKLILEIDSQIQIVGHADSITSAVSLFNQWPNIDLALMDIELADGQSFEIFNQVTVKCPVIFTTAYDEFALKAFKVNSIDYLLKPIDPNELKIAIEKFKRIHSKPEQINLNQLLQAFQSTNSQNYKQRFLVKLGQKLISIAATDIAYFHAQEKVVYLVSKDQKKYIVDYKLDELEAQLNDHDFFRITRSFIIHIQSIVKVHKYFNSRLLVEVKPAVEEQLLVSRIKVDAFLNWLDK